MERSAVASSPSQKKATTAAKTRSFRDIFFFAWPKVAVVDAFVAGQRRRGYAGGKHHFVNSGNRFKGRLEIAGPKALRNQQRRPSMLVLLVPDLNFSAV